MKRLTRKNLDELAVTMPRIREMEQRTMIGGDHVVVNVNRLYYGDHSTMSHFMATAYDDSGNIVGCITGVFLEPVTDYDQCTTSGSNTAIPAGTYNIVTGTYHGQTGCYMLDGVPGRDGIFIHPGNTSGDTTGCLLPGTTGSYNDTTNDSGVSGSVNMRNQLYSMFNQHGDGGISIKLTI